MTSQSSSGVSFKLNKSGKGKLKSQQKPLNEDHFDEIEHKDYLFSVEDQQLNSVVPKAPPKEYIIPLIKTNNWRIQEGGGASQDLKTTPTTSANNEEENVSTTPTDKDINQQAAEAILRDVAAGVFLDKEQRGVVGGEDKGLIIPLLMQNKPPVQIEEDKLNDLPFRPDESTLNDYSSMPIEHFGSAMLKGMGWKPGQAIGLNKKGLVEPIEYIPHPGGLGLGATPRPPDPKKKQKIKKPGEIEVKRPLPYKDKDGRVKHVKKIGEEIPQQKPEGLCVGNYARVLDGPHEDLYGKIVAVDETTITLRLAINNESLRFEQSQLEFVYEEEFKKYGRITKNKRHSPSTETKQYGLILSSSSSTLRHHDDTSHYHDNREREDTYREHSSNRKREMRRGEDERERDRKKKKSNEHNEINDYRHHTKRTHKNLEDYEEEEERDRKKKKSKRHNDDIDHHTKRTHSKKTSKHDPSRLKDSSSETKERREGWVTSNLRVRIIDKEYKKGIHYNKKVHIIDVIDLDMCICQTDEGKLLEGISQYMLETVVPKSVDSDPVMIVSGHMKGQLANIIQLNSSKFQALVQDVQTKELLTLSYDEICQYRT